MTKANPREGKTWPAYILGGRLRTSTLVLLVAFIGIGWVYHTWEPPARAPEQVPASEVVPPGFIPDPAYTWAPRTNFQRPTTATTPATTEPTTTEPTTPTTTPGEEPHGPSTSGEPMTSAVPSPSPVTTPVPSPSPSGTPSAPPGPPPGPSPPAPRPGV